MQGTARVKKRKEKGPHYDIKTRFSRNVQFLGTPNVTLIAS